MVFLFWTSKNPLGRNEYPNLQCWLQGIGPMCPWAPVTTRHLEPWFQPVGWKPVGLPMGWNPHGGSKPTRFFCIFFFTFSERLKGFEFHKDELENCRVFLFELFFLKTNKVPHLRKRRNKHGWEVTFHVFEPLPQSIIPTALVKLHRAERDEDFPWNIYHDVTLEVVKKSQHSTQNLLLKMIYMRNGWAQNLNQISVLYCCFFLLLVN